MKLLLIILTLLLSVKCLNAQIPEIISEFEEVEEVEPEMPKKIKGEIYGYYSKNGKCGFNIAGQERKEPEFDKINSFNEIYIVKKGTKFGLLDKRAQSIVSFKYDSISFFSRNFDALKVWKKGKVGIINSKGKLVVEFATNDISFANNDFSFLIRVDKAGNKEVKQKNGKPFPYPYDFIKVLKNGLIVVKDNKYGFVSNGELVIPFEYDEINVHGISISPNSKKIITRYSNLQIPELIVRKNGKSGIFSPEGGEIVPVECDQIKYDESKRFYYLTKERKQGAYLAGRKKYISMEYDRIYLDGMQYITLTKDGMQGILNYELETIIPFEYDKIRLKGGNKGFLVTKDGKQGWLDKEGKILIPVAYTKLDDFYDSGFSGFYKVSIGDSSGIIDLEGEQVVPVIYDFVYTQKQFFVGITKERKVGAYNKSGEEVLPTEYNRVYKSITRQSDAIILEKEGKQGILGDEGAIVLPVEHKKITYFHNSELLFNPETLNGQALLHIVNENGKSAVFDEYKMKLVIPFAYDDILQKFETHSTTYLIARIGKEYGVIDSRNKVIVPFKYSAINFDQLPGIYGQVDLTKYTIPVALKGKYGVINMKNEIVVPFEYEEVKRISRDGFFKAKREGKYVILSPSGDVLEGGPFDYVGLFEDEWALTFTNGLMSPFHKTKGVENFEKAMQPHNGYTTFEALKEALIDAFNSDDDKKLEAFAEKIAPSAHMMYYVEMAFKAKPELRYLNSDQVKERYYKELLKFKYQEWQQGYRKSSLTNVNDFTDLNQGMVSNYRTTDHAYGSVRVLEKFLRNCIKVNGYWISSYFLKRRF